MHLAEWRKSQGLTLSDAAARLGIADANPARTLQRFETGERRPSATVVSSIEAATAGAVTAQDMHDVRLHWERANASKETA